MRRGPVAYRLTAPPVVVAAGVAMFALVLLLRLSVTLPGFAFTLLFAVPVAVVAVALGVRPGIGAAVLGLVLVAVSDAAAPIREHGLPIHTNAFGYASWALLFFLLGGLLGAYSDRLRRVADQFQGLVDAAPDAMVIVGERAQVELANAQAEALLGYTHTELLGLPIEALVPERYRQQHVGHRTSFFGAPHARPMGAGLELYALHKDGREIPVEVSLGPLQTDRGTLVSAALRDVTERKRAQDALREAKERLRMVIENSVDAITITDPSGVYQYASPASGTVLGWEPEELMGRSGYEFLHPDDLELVRERHDVWLEHPESEPFINERRGRRKDGTYVWLESRATPIHDPQTGRIVELQVTTRDVTARKRAEAKVEAALVRELDAAERLRDVDRLKDEFLSTVSHELRTPLTAIMALAEVLEVSTGIEEGRRADLLGRISKSAGDMSAMIGQILDYSRLEAGKVALEVGALPLRDAVLQCVDLVRGPIGARPTLIDVPADLTVHADRRGFERILVNLLSNAAKYSPEGSPIRVSATRDNGDATVAVHDEGIGIPAAEQSLVFERFYQGSSVPGKRGTGVGLSIVRRYVELLGGEVWVESKPGRGSRFRFTLPTGGGTE